uniref:Na(+)/H(+) exchange regulatory cofactor NHE-RF n=1 Tax=Sinocyclocheilus anshuiensis TaxID=1608454 RepID=A0A671KDY0_9TELE
LSNPLSLLRPRLCYLTKGDRGYGFHLHGERNRGAQLIRRIEPGSPADLSGLRSGDRVVEVNGENVEGETHQQVVQRILEVEYRTRLLVVDRVTDEFLKFHGLPCTEDRAIEMGSLSSRSSAASSPRASPRDSEETALEEDVVLKDLRPRSCHMTIGEQGYGFNLHCKKSRVGQFIRSVDPDSPAERVGLRPRDRLIEVNDRSVEGLRHAEVVALIRAGGTDTRLLVVDPDTDELFNRLRIVPTSIHLKGTVSSSIINVLPVQKPCVVFSQLTDSDHLSSDDAPKPKPDVNSEERPLDPFWESGLHLSLTAAEAKQKARAKRPNKRAPPMDWSKKQEIFGNF